MRAAIVISLTIWAAAGANALAQTATLRFGQIPSTVRGTSSVYLHIAEQKGYFARENIKLERVVIPWKVE